MQAMFNTATSFNKNLGNWILNANVDLSSMLNNGGMDCDNYSATLVGWQANNPSVINRNLGAFNRLYGTSALAARDILVNDRGWTINDTAANDSCDAALSIDLVSVLDNKVQIYPNPATEWFMVKLNSKANFNLELFSIMGQLIKTYKNVNGDLQIFTKNLPQGVYLLDIYNQSNNQSERKKIVIQ
jgi:hypothetical protein